MRLFVYTDSNGNIHSAVKVTVMAADLEHPYGRLNPGDVVVEIPLTPELEALDSHEICDRYTVDFQINQLTLKDA